MKFIDLPFHERSKAYAQRTIDRLNFERTLDWIAGLGLGLGLCGLFTFWRWGFCIAAVVGIALQLWTLFYRRRAKRLMRRAWDVENAQHGWTDDETQTFVVTDLPHIEDPRKPPAAIQTFRN